jgi:transposase-like protein
MVAHLMLPPGRHQGGLAPEKRHWLEVLYLALADLAKKWERSIREWSNVLGQFAVFFEDRLPNL